MGRREFWGELWGKLRSWELCTQASLSSCVQDFTNPAFVITIWSGSEKERQDTQQDSNTVCWEILTQVIGRFQCKLASENVCTSSLSLAESKSVRKWRAAWNPKFSHRRTICPNWSSALALFVQQPLSLLTRCRKRGGSKCCAHAILWNFQSPNHVPCLPEFNPSVSQKIGF